jgi:hypothetical protein
MRLKDEVDVEYVGPGIVATLAVATAREKRFEKVEQQAKPPAFLSSHSQDLRRLLEAW